MPKPGRLILFSGPSGSGKSTVTQRLLNECPLPLRLSVSATTRSPRPGETDGIEYHFLTEQRFEELREADAFLECKEVFGRNWYGTLREEVRRGISDGDWVILEIDVQGAISVMEQAEIEPLSFFIHPGNAAELERRLRDRGTETDDAIRNRLETAAKEMECLPRYRYEIINSTVDVAVAQICQILEDHKENEAC